MLILIHKLKKNKGITLIALVVTIIVLLILAGISISMLMGQNGILNRAAEAKEKTVLSNNNEKHDLVKMEELINDNLDEEKVEQINDENPGILEQEASDNNGYIINSIEDFVVFSYNVTNGDTYEGKTIKLGVNLDFNSTKSYNNAFREDYGEYGYEGELRENLISKIGWNSIGNKININQNSFKGTFDGNNKCIYNLYIKNKNINETKFIGLFANNQGIIKNLKLKNVKIETSGNDEVYYFVAGIAGGNEGTILNCSTNGICKSNGNYALAAGISGRNQGIIESCMNEINVSGRAMYMSGIVAQNLSKIKKCENNGTISSEKDGKYIGGITGLGYSDNILNGDSIIEESFNKGKIVVNASSSLHVGGIVGQAQCWIKNCYNMGDITFNTENEEINCNLGGIAGVQVGLIQNCYNKNLIKEEKNNGNIFVGGIIGSFHQYTLKNLYSETTFETGDSVKKGGTIGLIVDEPNVLEVKNLNFYGQEESIGSNLSKFDFNSNKLNEKPSHVKILEFVNDDNENKFKEDKNNINEGYPVLYWQ